MSATPPESDKATQPEEEVNTPWIFPASSPLFSEWLKLEVSKRSQQDAQAAKRRRKKKNESGNQ